jgi:hypothetical protein
MDRRLAAVMQKGDDVIMNGLIYTYGGVKKFWPHGVTDNTGKFKRRKYTLQELEDMGFTLITSYYVRANG